jgi:hypothetical protein
MAAQAGQLQQYGADAAELLGYLPHMEQEQQDAEVDAFFEGFKTWLSSVDPGPPIFAMLALWQEHGLLTEVERIAITSPWLAGVRLKKRQAICQATDAAVQVAGQASSAVDTAAAVSSGATPSNTGSLITKRGGRHTSA